jgi:hypothetical protein
MVQKMFFGLTDVSLKILLYTLGYSLDSKHHILTHFCQMFLPAKSYNNLRKSCSTLTPTMLMKLSNSPTTLCNVQGPHLKVNGAKGSPLFHQFFLLSFFCIYYTTAFAPSAIFWQIFAKYFCY